MCADGSFAQQVVIQELKDGAIRLVCKHTGGEAEVVADGLLREAERLVRKRGLIVRGDEAG